MPPADVVHVGDRPAKDVAGATAVGMRCLRVRTGEYADTPDPAGLVPWKSAGSFLAAVELLLPLLESPARSRGNSRGPPLGYDGWTCLWQTGPLVPVHAPPSRGGDPATVPP